jgi:hypothetical protein
MGAYLATQRAEGKDPREAYVTAVANASAEYGHQDGYSGAINSKAQGFCLVTLPPRMSYATFMELLDELENTDGWREYKESVAWREEVIAAHKHKQWPERAAVRHALQKDQQYLRLAITKRKKFIARVERSGMSLDTLKSYAQVFNDKWDVPLCIELRTSEAKPTKRGSRVYLFTGYAPS